MNLEEYLADISSNNIQKAIDILKSRLLSKSSEKIIVQSECSNSANYHKNKYKHWIKTVESIDSNKTDGYAFIGEWLSKFGQNEVNPLTWILEYDCNYTYSFYQAKDAQNKDKHIIGKKKSFITFRNECSKAFYGDDLNG